MTVTFGDLPEGDRTSPAARSAHHVAVAAQLRARPGEWAHVETLPNASYASAHAHRIRTGNALAYRPAGTFDAVARTVEGEYRVYARYVGEQPEQGAAR